MVDLPPVAKNPVQSAPVFGLGEAAMDAGAGSGAMGRFAELKGESAGGLEALDDALKLTGLPVRIASVSNNPYLKDNVAMRYYADSRRVEINSRLVTSRAIMAQQMAEELLHAVDNVGNGHTLSAGSSLMDLEYGAMAVEVQGHYANDGFFAEFFNYPLHPLENFTTDRTKAELFARLGVLYFAHPEVLKRELPVAYGAFHELFGLSQSSPYDGAYVRSKIWEATRGDAQDGLRHRNISAVGSGNGASSGEEPSHLGLVALQLAVAKVIDAPPKGKLAILE